MSNEDDWQTITLYRISKVNTYYVIQDVEDHYFLVTSMNAWYDFYNAYLPVNSRLAMQLTPEQRAALPLKAINDGKEFGFWRYWLLSLGAVFLEFFCEVFFQQEIVWGLGIGLGILLGLQYRRLTVARDADQNPIIRQFKATHTLKIRPHIGLGLVVPVLIDWALVFVVMALELPFVSPFVGMIFLMGYGSLGRIRTEVTIHSNIPNSFYRWREWGNRELIEVDTPAEMRPPIKLDLQD